MSCKKSCSQQWTKLLVLLLIVWLVASQQRTWIGPWSGAISPSHGQKNSENHRDLFFLFSSFIQLGSLSITLTWTFQHVARH